MSAIHTQNPTYICAFEQKPKDDQTRLAMEAWERSRETDETEDDQGGT